MKHTKVFLFIGVYEYGKSHGSSNAESYRGDAGDREHDEADAAGGSHARGDGHAGPRPDDEEEGEEIIGSILYEMKRKIIHCMCI